MYNKILYLLDKFVKSCKSNVVTNLQAGQTARVQGICHQSLYFATGIQFQLQLLNNGFDKFLLNPVIMYLDNSYTLLHI